MNKKLTKKQIQTIERIASKHIKDYNSDIDDYNYLHPLFGQRYSMPIDARIINHFFSYATRAKKTARDLMNAIIDLNPKLEKYRSAQDEKLRDIIGGMVSMLNPEDIDYFINVDMNERKTEDVEENQKVKTEASKKMDMINGESIHFVLSKQTIDKMRDVLKDMEEKETITQIYTKNDFNHWKQKHAIEPTEEEIEGMRNIGYSFNQEENTFIDDDGIRIFKAKYLAGRTREEKVFKVMPNGKKYTMYETTLNNMIKRIGEGSIQI